MTTSLGKKGPSGEVEGCSLSAGVLGSFSPFRTSGNSPVCLVLGERGDPLIYASK